MRNSNKAETTRKSSEGRLRKSSEGLTVLQNEAANAVNEIEDEPVANNEERYEQMLETRKFRRAVSAAFYLNLIAYSLDRVSVFMTSWRDRSRTKCGSLLELRFKTFRAVFSTKWSPEMCRQTCASTRWVLVGRLRAEAREAVTKPTAMKKDLQW